MIYKGINAFGVKQTNQNKRIHQHDEHVLISHHPDGKGIQCIAQFDSWNPISGILRMK